MTAPVPSDNRVGAIRRAIERPLSDEETLQVRELDDLVTGFIEACNRIGKSRALAIAITNAEQAQMWALRHFSQEN